MNFPESLWNHIPGWAAASIILVGAGVWILSRLSGAYAGVAKMVPVMGKVWRRRAVHTADAVRLDGELADLRRIVEFQGRQLEELRDRDELYWAWILLDQDWHRREEFRAISENRTLEPHVSYMQFRDNWLAKHPKREELPF